MLPIIYLHGGISDNLIYFLSSKYYRVASYKYIVISHKLEIIMTLRLIKPLFQTAAKA